MHWFDVDGARDYRSSGGRKPSRKAMYAMVKDGLRVVRIGDTGRRMLFCAEWIDEYLIARARVEPATPSDETSVAFTPRRRA